MTTIKLRNGQWYYDSNATLGPPGGFGAVYVGTDSAGNEVAVKKLHLSTASAGHRELVIAEELEGKNLSYVIPIYDSGIDADSGQYFVVMAKAEKSLQDDLNSGPFDEGDAVHVLNQIANGIAEIKDFVHRDLKPGNILFHEGIWKLTDFGIARFVEKATSANTLKDCLSPYYAAPEQWRLERATNATDIYAFGCIAYALLEGDPPFTSGDVRTRHLHEDPQSPTASPKMKQLVSLCLRKNPQARPVIASVQRQLNIIGSKPKSPSPIAAAGAAIALEQAKNEAEAARVRTDHEMRSELARDALKSLDFILEMMFQAILDDAPVSRKASKRSIELGSGKLIVEVPFALIPADAFPNSKKNIVCGALIRVEQTQPHYPGRSANLWFGDFAGSGEFRWWEIPYFNLSHHKPRFYPYGVSSESGLRDADFAAAPIMHTVQQAAQPVTIDAEQTEDFIRRWVVRLAAASRNALQRPSRLPE